MKSFIISPPFGNFIRHSRCTPVMGTYTLYKRGGWIKKLYRMALTVRPIENGWLNNIGLQNPGIKSVKYYNPDRIYSIAAIESPEWDQLLEYIPKEASVELNLSCPNIEEKHDIEDRQIIAYLNKYPLVIFKLSPTKGIYREIDRLTRLGANHLHIANTIPTSKGGESGLRLKEFCLETIRATKLKYPTVKIIGGGGIYSFADVELYVKAGADYFSLASIWFNPFKAVQLLKQYH